jgi:Poly(ADP-ribose) polymerase catalytic domain
MGLCFSREESPGGQNDSRHRDAPEDGWVVVSEEDVSRQESEERIQRQQQTRRITEKTTLLGSSSGAFYEGRGVATRQFPSSGEEDDGDDNGSYSRRGTRGRRGHERGHRGRGRRNRSDLDRSRRDSLAEKRQERAAQKEQKRRERRGSNAVKKAQQKASRTHVADVHSVPKYWKPALLSQSQSQSSSSSDTAANFAGKKVPPSVLAESLGIPREPAAAAAAAVAPSSPTPSSSSENFRGGRGRMGRRGGFGGGGRMMQQQHRETPRFVLTDLDPETSSEFQAVQQLFSANVGHHGDKFGTVRGCDPKDFRVTRVTRVQNLELWRAFEFARNRIAQASNFALMNAPCSRALEAPGCGLLTPRLDATTNEYYLFHGTRDAVIDTIIRTGFDERLGSVSGMFGGGIYLAENSSKSNQYVPCGGCGEGSIVSLGECTCDPEADLPVQRMLLCRVLLGDVHIAHEYDPEKYKGPRENPVRRPPVKSDVAAPDDIPVLHDSVMGEKRELGGPLFYREFVVYDRYQVYPEYVVEYERVPFASGEDRGSAIGEPERDEFLPSWGAESEKTGDGPAVAVVSLAAEPGGGDGDDFGVDLIDDDQGATEDLRADLAALEASLSDSDESEEEQNYAQRVDDATS